MLGDETGVLALDRFYSLTEGMRVRLRLARSSDRTGVRELLERAGLTNDLEAGRLVRFDPREQLVICATALIEGRETTVGLGSIELGSAPPHVSRGRLGSDTPPQPRVLAVDGRVPAIGELLTEALAGRANALRRIRAA